MWFLRRSQATCKEARHVCPNNKGDDRITGYAMALGDAAQAAENRQQALVDELVAGRCWGAGNNRKTLGYCPYLNICGLLLPSGT